MRVASIVELESQEERRLTQLARSNTATVREARRAQIVLLAAQGKSNHEIAQMLGVGRIVLAFTRVEPGIWSRTWR